MIMVVVVVVAVEGEEGLSSITGMTRMTTTMTTTEGGGDTGVDETMTPEPWGYLFFPEGFLRSPGFLGVLGSAMELV